MGAAGHRLHQLSAMFAFGRLNPGFRDSYAPRVASRSHVRLPHILGPRATRLLFSCTRRVVDMGCDDIF